MSRNPSKQQTAALRVCASCEWVFDRVRARGPLDDHATPASEEDSRTIDSSGCPKCGFASYGAHWVYGPKCYRFKRTQEPWLARKVQAYTQQLRQEIGTANAARDPADLFHGT